LHLEDKVRLVGFRPQAAAFEMVQSGAVFAAPCIVGRDGNRDGLPTVLLEAMALGTPCISTDVTGIPEIIRDGETGLIVPQGDAPALAASLERLLADAALRVGLATAARRLIETEFDTTRNTEALRQLFVCNEAATIRSTHPSHP
jgi:colanic acid/amylovoran biosynthesis glycosyltransferase